MLMVRIVQLHPDKVERLRAWMHGLRDRTDEVRATFAQEGVHHEIAWLVQGHDGPIMVYAVEVDDPAAARRAYDASILPIDHEHRQIMQEVTAGPAVTEKLYECTLPR
jgi:uncharacterized protein DUF6176